MRKSWLISSVLTMALLAGACHPSVDLEKERAAILEFHAAAIQAHLDRNADWFAENRADDGDYVQASRGEIAWPTREEVRKRFADYLGRTEFSEYRDLVEPIVRVSQDGTLAWAIVQVKVSGVQTNDEGEEEPFDWVSAWIELFEKRNGRWVMVGNLSNMRP